MKGFYLTLVYWISGALLLGASVEDGKSTSSNGPVWVEAWGYNNGGQIPVPAGLNDVIGISAGSGYGVALRRDGSITAWGGGDASRNVPTGSTFTAVSAGSGISLALKDDGTVVSWGIDLSPRELVPSGLSNVIAIAGGGVQSLALKSDGTVVGWGSYSRVPPDTTNVVAMAAGIHHCLLLKANGTVESYGYDFVQHGVTNVPSGLSNVIAVAASDLSSMALKSDGTVILWGLVQEPSLGLSNVVAIACGDSHWLALKRDGALVTWGDNTYGQTNIPSGLTNITSIAANGAWSMVLSTHPGECIPRSAKAIPQVVNGVLTGVNVIDPGCGYTNVPAVLIQGGAGLGALTQAVIDNGRVLRIDILNGGSGYIFPPRVLIASPPFVPTLKIVVNRVLIIQKVMLTKKYVLESSLDGNVWVEAASPFIAISELITNEFDTSMMGRLFRIREIP